MTIKQEQKQELSDKDFAYHGFLESQIHVTGIDVYQFIGNQTDFVVLKTETNKPPVTGAPQTDTAMAHEAEQNSTVSNIETSATSDTTSESVTYSSYSYASYTKMAAPQINFSSILPATSDAVLANGQTEASTDTVAPADSTSDAFAIGTDSTVDDNAAVNADAEASESVPTDTSATSDSSVTGSVDYASYTTLVEPVIAICPIMTLPPVVIQITDPNNANPSTDTSIAPVDSHLGASIDINSDTTGDDAMGSDNNTDLPATDSSLTDEQATGDTSGSDGSTVDLVKPIVCPIIDFGYYLQVIEPWYGFDIEQPVDIAVDPMPWIWYPVHIDPMPWLWNLETTELDTDMGSILLSDTTDVTASDETASDETQTTDSSSPETNLETNSDNRDTSTDTASIDNQENTTETDVTVNYNAEPITYYCCVFSTAPMPLGIASETDSYSPAPIFLDTTAVQAPDLTLLGTSDIQLQMF